MRVCFVLCLLALCQTRSQAQTNTSPSTVSTNPRLEVAYSGATIFHPGLAINYTKPIATKRNETRQSQHEFLIGGNAGFYFHKRRHTAVYAGANAAWIKTSRKGFQYGFELPFGYLRAFVPNVYELDASGDVKKLSLVGTNHVTVSPAFRLGHRYSDDALINGWFVKNRLMFVAPYAGGVAKQYLLEVGIVKLLN